MSKDTPSKLHAHHMFRRYFQRQAVHTQVDTTKTKKIYICKGRISTEVEV